jgi:hypothetical protein
VLLLTYKVWDAIHLEDLEGTEHAGHAEERGEHDAPAGGGHHHITTFLGAEQIAARKKVRATLAG